MSILIDSPPALAGGAGGGSSSTFRHEEEKNHPRPLREGAEGRWSKVRHVLVSRPDNIGDVLLVEPVIRALKAALPGVHLTLLVSKAGAQALPLIDSIDDAIVARPAWQELGGRVTPQEERALIERLAEGRFDAAVLLTSFSQSPHPPALACRMAGVPLILGESSERAPDLLTDEPAAPTPLAAHQVERNLRLLETIGVSVADRRVRLRVPDEARRWARDWLGGRRAIVFAPFASCAARTYDPARAAAAARDLGRLTGLPVVLTGAPADAERAGPLRRILGKPLDAIGQTDVPRLAALIERAALVLTNNTSALHLADAFAAPVVVTYAGTDLVSQWAPRFSPAVVLNRPVPCAPCGLLACPIGQPCLAIAPEEIVAAGLGLLGPSERAAA